MAHHWSEGVGALRFTAREFQQELVEEALKRNLLSFPPPSAASFVSLKLVQELAHQIRPSDATKTVVLCPPHRLGALEFDLTHLTDLPTLRIDSSRPSAEAVRRARVIVCVSEAFDELLRTKALRTTNVNLLVVEHCHLIDEDVHLQSVMSHYRESEEPKPRILAFSHPLFSPSENRFESFKESSSVVRRILEDVSDKYPQDRASILDDPHRIDEPAVPECLKHFVAPCPIGADEESFSETNAFSFWRLPCEDIPFEPEKESPVRVRLEPKRGSLYEVLECRMERLEKSLCCQTDMASDVVGLKRITGRPKEVILECRPLAEEDKCQHRKQLETYMRCTIRKALLFINDHRYDPTEIYDDEIYNEELKAIPNPCNEPKEMLELFLHILEEAGPYAAEKAAYFLQMKIEKLKIKIPYERHFLLLSLVASVFFEIRVAAEYIFDKYPSDRDKVVLFSTPKVLRLMDVLRLFQPSSESTTKSAEASPKVSAKSTGKPIQNESNNEILKIHSDNTTECVTINKIDVNNGQNATDHEKSAEINTENPKLKKFEDCSQISNNIDGKNSDVKDCTRLTNNVESKNEPPESPSRARKPFGPKKGQNFRGRGRGRGARGYGYSGRYHNFNNDPDALCGLVFVEEPLMAKILCPLINEYCRNDDDLKFVCAQYTINKVADPLTDPKEAELEHKLQEEVLKRFRIHECNLLVGTSFLEEGMDLPKCNLVVRWDVPNGYRSYARCRARARAPRSLFAMLVLPPPEPLVTSLAHFSYIEKMLVKKCAWQEPPASEEALAAKFTPLIEAYRPSSAAVNLSSAVALLNRYCAKLPSDTFTRLVPLWSTEEISYRGHRLYVCTIRLPINCPLKHHIVGHPMPNRVLARRTAALQACRALHLAGELDDNLMPIGKEGFRATESDWLSLPPASDLPKSSQNVAVTQNDVGDNFFGDASGGFEPRPGTTKRKQYYYKKVARALTDCRPVLGEPCLVYQIHAWLACPLPEKHNTRGRKLHPPEAYAEGFAILTSKPIQKIPVFPIFTRSGEVRISLKKLPARVIITRKRQRLIHYFMKYTFAEVLRVHNHLMLFDDEGKQKRNSFYVVPTSKIATEDGKSKVVVDWNFLELIYEQTESSVDEQRSLSNLNTAEIMREKENILLVERGVEDDAEKSADENPIRENKLPNLPNPYLKPGEVFEFDSEKFRDAVVMPWYRNQDQPQYFYVAEICWHLSPRSAFPSAQHSTFEEYYHHKYGVKITHVGQPLLDVDHTSARLNLLTPRFVNRKGIALPTSSERTKRAKRESLEQKQILVPELCCAHPFRGALWRAAVALPCILYRINCLLLADEIRKSVAVCVALGKPCPDRDFEWPSLDFGWNLADVLAGDGAKEAAKESEKTIEEIPIDRDSVEDESGTDAKNEESVEKSANEILKEREEAEEGSDAFEIGTWSNDMAAQVPTAESDRDEDDESVMASTKLPDNLTICTSIGGGADWNLLDAESSPKKSHRGSHQRKFSMADSVMSYGSSDFEGSDDSSDGMNSDSDDYDTPVHGSDSFAQQSGVRIEFRSSNEAEAIEIVDSDAVVPKTVKEVGLAEMELAQEEKSMESFNNFFYTHKNDDDDSKLHAMKFEQAIASNEQKLLNNGILVKPDRNLDYLKPQNLSETLSKLTSDPEATKLEYISNVDIDEDNINPFPETVETALSKRELLDLYEEMFPYECELGRDGFDLGLLEDGHIALDKLEKNKRTILNELKKSMDDKEWQKYNLFSMKDLDEDDFVITEPKKITALSNTNDRFETTEKKFKFSFDRQPDLENHPGPSPSLILQALTMSNANDGINLERLETIGDSFLKYAITTYLYCTYQNIHEGKLSHLRSKQVSNLNLYRLGRRKSLGSRMVAYKFEPHDNWLPPCHRVPPHLERALIDTQIPSTLWNVANMPRLSGLSKEEVEKLVRERVAQYHTIPNKIKNSFDDRIEDDNCAFHGKNSELIKNMTLSCYESEDLNAPIVACLKDDSYKCTCVVYSGYRESDRLSAGEVNRVEGEYVKLEGVPCFVPYNLITQHSIPDKSVADCVEALIGAYLIECGPRGALLFMAWLGIRVLPREEIVLSDDHPFVRAMTEAESLKASEDLEDCKLEKIEDEDAPSGRKDEAEADPYDFQDESSDFEEDGDWNWDGRIPGSLKPKKNDDGEWTQIVYGTLKPPPSPLLRYVPDPEGELMQMLSGYEGLERTLNYRFKDRTYLLQAMTHASYSPNRLTDCYQRLEFLGDAVLDYLITRQLYEDPRRHSPGALTDLRSALVNNTIFASLAVRHGMHKYFRHLSPGLNEVLSRFVKIQEENGHSISEDHFLIEEDECEQAEDVEVPKALGDLFESVAGAIFLDSGMSLDAVWRVYHALMQREIEAFSESVPKSPVRELLEMEPETAKFGKPEKLADGRRVRVSVEVLGVGVFKGVGRNYRIAKCTAAKCALRRLSSTSTRKHK